MGRWLWFAGLMVLGAAPARAQESDTLRLTLSDVVHRAAEHSPQVEVELLSEREGEAEVAQERSSLLPQASVDVTHGDRTFNTASFGLDFPAPSGGEPLFDPNGELVGPVTTIDLRGHVAQTLFDWAAIRRLRAARAELRADRSSTAAARERAAAEAAAAWVQARRAHDRLAARSADVRLGEELLEIARGLLEARIGVRLDVTRAQAQLAAMRAELVTARADAQRADLALLLSLNLPLDAVVVIADDESPEPAPDAARRVDGSYALAHRADLEVLEQRVEAARLSAAAARAERWPTISLSAGDGLTGAEYEHLLNSYEWALRVSVPVFDGRHGASADAAQARAQSLEVRLRDLERRIEFEVRDATLRLGSARELVAASAVRLDLANAELEQARARFRSGVSGSADVFTASLRLNEARSGAADARAALAAARVTLAIARGSVLDLR